MKKIKWESGLNLPKLAKEVSGSEEAWKYIAKLNKIDIFEKPIEVGIDLNIPEIEDIAAIFPNLNQLEKKIAEKALEELAFNQNKTISGVTQIRQFFLGGLLNE